jgi:DNA repair exonuclease SbcCD ATPase subunit
VIVAKKAIEELDKMSSYYLVESVKTLEPIINSVLDKVGFAVSFDVDLKGKFNILLQKEDTQYKYADLSTGEKLVLQIAFKLAILLRENKAELLVCDEGLGSLDAENLEHILEIIRALPTQLIMVLHRYEPTDTAIKVIQLTKGNNEKTEKD